MPRAKVVSFINYKGGVGKTTTTYHVGCSLVQHHNKKVLLIDTDPQTNLTFLCASIEDWQNFKRQRGTIATLYKRFTAGQTLDTKRVIWNAPVHSATSRIQNLDLIPCDIDLLGEDLGGAGALSGSYSTLEAIRKHAKQYLRERLFLHTVLREIEDKYDYALIDCAPNLYLMTQNALTASRHYVVTAIPDHLSTIGLQILQRKVRNIEQWIGSAQKFSGDESSKRVAAFGGVIFVKVRIGGTMITNTHAAIMTEVAQILGQGSCFEVHTTELIGYGEAAEGLVPVWMNPTENSRRAARKQEYQRITNEFTTRF